MNNIVKFGKCVTALKVLTVVCLTIPLVMIFNGIKGAGGHMALQLRPPAAWAGEATKIAEQMGNDAKLQQAIDLVTSLRKAFPSANGTREMWVKTGDKLGNVKCVLETKGVPKGAEQYEVTLTKRWDVTVNAVRPVSYWKYIVTSERAELVEFEDNDSAVVAMNAARMAELYAEAATPAEKVQLIILEGRSAVSRLTGAEKDELISWLEELSRNDDNGAVRQAVLGVLYYAGNKDALSRLVRDVEVNGVAWEGRIPHFGMDWQLLYDIYQNYPASYLARGMAAYEKVRGEPYFAITRAAEEEDPYTWMPGYEHGDQQYDPGREIPGWETFLEEFSGHPAADDAAYRLARCYEIKGRCQDALQTLQRTLNLPDGDIRYHVAGRITYILDVRMTGSQLAELSAAEPEPVIRQMSRYTLAVKTLRNEEYRKAAGMLEELLADLQSGAVSATLPPFISTGTIGEEEYDFIGAVKKQLEQAEKLAGLKEAWAKSQDPADHYNLAAAIFHDQSIYYNHLWAGHRQYFNWLGYVLDSYYSDDGKGPAEMAGFVREMINYCHSANLFKEVYENPAATSELKAKALYSLGLSRLGIYSWGEDAFVAFDREELKGEVIDTFEKFVQEFPSSTMADDALLALADLSGRRDYLDRIFSDYPQGDAVPKAEALLEKMS